MRPRTMAAFGPTQPLAAGLLVAVWLRTLAAGSEPLAAGLLVAVWLRTLAAGSR
jgi:hypothetical protein